MWLSLLSITLLFSLASPSGRWIAERRFVEASWRGRVVSLDGATVVDLGPDIFPVDWQEAPERLRAVRLVDDGHEMTEAEVGSVELESGGAVAWVPDTDLAGAGAAEAGSEAVTLWRSAYVVPFPDGADDGGATGTGAGAPLVVAIDPGHGGPGAGTWNGNNGDGAGARGPHGLTEQWVNLRVADFLARDLARDPRFVGSFPVRTTATQLVTLADRVALAAQGGADFYLSIHHNGLPAGAANRTEAYWCALNEHAADGPDAAWALHDRVVDAFGCTPRGAFEDSAGTGRFHFYVLRHAPMPAVLVEASNLNDAAEEALFGNDPLERHAKAEAVALHLGLVDWAFGTTGIPETPPPGAIVTIGAPVAREGGGLRLTVETTARGPFDAALVDPLGRRVARLGTFAGPGRATLEVPGPGRGPRWLVIRAGGTIVASCSVPRP